MADAAYFVFFAAVFVGGASFVHAMIATERQRIAAALRGERFQEVVPPETAGQVSISKRTLPMLQPVSINICRL